MNGHRIPASKLDAYSMEYGSDMPVGLPELLENAVFGSDGLRYQRLRVKDQINRLNRPFFFSAWLQGELIGGYVLDKRRLRIGHDIVPGYYRGALVVKRENQGLGVGSELTRLAAQWQQNQSVGAGKPFVSYGCIDASNKRSLAVLEKHNTKIVGRLSMYMMYRQWPRVRCELVDIDKGRQEEVSALGQQVYSDCVVRDITPVNQSRVALLDADGVAISACVAETAFRIDTMGVAVDWATRLLVKPWPPARKRFDTNRFRYLSLTEVLIRPGCEAQWSAFVSSTLARYNLHFAAVYLDTRTSLFHQLRNSQPLGKWLHSGSGTICVVARLDDSDRIFPDLLDQDRPWCVWPVDA